LIPQIKPKSLSETSVWAKKKSENCLKHLPDAFYWPSSLGY